MYHKYLNILCQATSLVKNPNLLILGTFIILLTIMTPKTVWHWRVVLQIY